MEKYREDELKVFKPSSQSQWSLQEGGFIQAERFEGASSLRYETALSNNIKVEWDLLKANVNRNLNAFIAGRDRVNGYTFHIGSWGISSYCAMTRADKVVDIHQIPEGVDIQSTQRFTMEKLNANIRLLINGNVIFDYEDYDLLDGPEHLQFGIEVGDNSLNIDNISIYTLPPQNLPTELNRAQRLYNTGDFEKAVEAYRNYAKHHPHGEFSALTQWKIIHALIALDQPEEALKLTEAWLVAHPDHPHHHHGTFIKGKLLMQLEQSHLALPELMKLTDAPRSIRHLAFNELEHYLANQKSVLEGLQGYDIDMDVLRDVHYRLQSWMTAFELPLLLSPLMGKCSTIMNERGRHEDVLLKYPNCHWGQINALQMRGEWDVILRDFKVNNDAYTDALLKLGRYEEVIASQPDQQTFTVLALCRLGRHDEAIQRFSDDPFLEAIAHYDLGDFKRCLKLRGPTFDDSLMALGRYKQLLKLKRATELDKAIAHLYLQQPKGLLDILSDESMTWDRDMIKTLYHGYRSVTFAQKGEGQKALEELQQAPFEDISYLQKKPQFLFTRFFLEPWMEYFIKQKFPRARLERISRQNRYHLYQVPYHQSEFLLGNINEQEYLAQPLTYSKAWQQGCLHNLKGLKADLDGRHREAQIHYKKALQQPWQHRDIDPVRDLFISWRLSEISKMNL